jgi:nucleoid-associated protein YgaU
VTVVIAPGRNVPPLVALSAPDQPTVVLSKPEEPEQGAVASTGPDTGGGPAQGGADAGARAQVKVTAVETQENGRLFVSGRASPGATVRLYLNDSFVAPGATGSDGKFSFTIGRGLKEGDYRVRLDDVDPVSGDVKSRAEVAFVVPPQALAGVLAPGTGGTGAAANAERRFLTARPETKPDGATVHVPEVVTATVAPGDNLWQISRRTYGHGLRYTVIYGANQKQIRNPDRIYPGQIFVLPAENRPDAAPAAPNP